MKATLSAFVFLVSSSLLMAAMMADSEISGTWSGGWTPKGGVRDAVTIELKQDATTGVVTGRFRTPAAMDFSKATFNSKTGLVVLEAVDPQSGKRYKIDGKIEGTELKGMLDVSGVPGDLNLIKWTFVPR